MKNVIAFAVALSIAASAMAQSAGVEVTRAWARATPGKAENGAAYLTIESAVGDRLTGISTPAAKKAELHTMSMDGNVMKMRPLAGLDLPAGQKVALKPGAVHIMLMGLSEPLRAGQSFPLTLRFEKSGSREINVVVESAGAMGPEKAADGGIPMPAGR